MYFIYCAVVCFLTIITNNFACLSLAFILMLHIFMSELQSMLNIHIVSGSFFLQIFLHALESLMNRFFFIFFFFNAMAS